MRNEIVFAAVEMLATSAGEPHIVGRVWKKDRGEIRNEEQRLLNVGVPRREVNARLVRNGYYQPLENHALVRLLDKPNPWMSRGQMWGTVVMDRALAGNAYLLKSRVQSGILKGAVGELWRLRPDRVKVIPSATNFIDGYEYRAGQDVVTFPASDVIHFKTRHPLNDYYGMPPLMAASNRVDIDEYMKSFLRSFFERGGTGPGAVLTVKNKLSEENKTEIRERKNKLFNGAAGMGEWLILDNSESTYTPLGLNRGVRDALPKEIHAMQEAGIAMVFGIPGSILGLLIGYESSSYANKRQDWQVFWDLTMTPLLSDLDDALNLQLVPDFKGIDEVLFDLSDIRALQEDVDKLQERHLKALEKGAVSLEESRDAIGYNPEIKGGTFYIPSTAVPTAYDKLVGEEASGAVQSLALNGAQIASLLEIIQQVTLDAIAVDAAKQLIKASFPALTDGQISTMVDAAAAFTPAVTVTPGSPLKLPSGPDNIVAEVHCPKCGRWVGRNMNVGATAYCPKDKEVPVTREDEKPLTIEIVRDEEGRAAQLVGVK